MLNKVFNRRELNDKQRYIAKLEDHYVSAKSSERYSSDRFDILIISISTAALILTMSFSENLIGESSNVGTGLLKVSWLLFVVTIILNLSSQLSSFYAHRYDAKVTKNIIRRQRGKPEKGNQSKFECLYSLFSKSTNTLNLVSFATLFSAIICILIFYSKTI